MTDKTPTMKVGSSLEEPTVRRIVHTGLALAGLLVAVGLLAVTPGIDRLLAALAVSPWAVVIATVTLLISGALLWAAPEIERAVRQSLSGPEEAVDNAAAAAKLLVGFLAVVVAYRGLAPALTPTFEAFDIGGLYHLAFLVVGLAVLGAFLRRLYHCWEPVTDLLTDYLVDASGRETEQVTGEH